jgi:hypothetical protein
MSGVVPRNRIFLSWLLTGLIVFGCFVSGVGLLWVAAGLLIAAWGVAVAANYRGTADAMPTRTGFGPFWQETSRGMIRFIFSFFALWGVGLAVAGIIKTLH